MDRPKDETPNCIVFMPNDVSLRATSWEGVQVPEEPDRVWIPSLHASVHKKNFMAVLPLEEGLKVEAQLDEFDYLYRAQCHALWVQYMQAAGVALPQLIAWRKANGRAVT